MSHNLKIVDKAADTWFIHTGAYRMVDPTTNHAFEPGEKYKMFKSDWMGGQPTIKETDDSEDVEVLEPHQPGDQIQLMAAAQEAVVAETKKPRGK